MSSLRSIVLASAVIAGTTLAVSMPAMSQAGDNYNLIFVEPKPTVTGNRRTVNNVTTQPVTQPSTSGNPVRKRPPEDSPVIFCNRDSGCADSQPPTNKDTRNTGTVRIRR